MQFCLVTALYYRHFNFGWKTLNESLTHYSEEMFNSQGQTIMTHMETINR